MIDAHRGAFEYEWRARFHLPLRVVGRSMSWGEALRLFRILAADPSSHLAAAVAEWSHPMSREALILADLYDLQHRAAGAKRPKPYPRPWTVKRTRTAPDAAITQADVIEALRKAGHTAPLPEQAA